MAIPLIIGIGIDSGVHVMHRTAQGTPPSRVAETAGRAVTISSLTTMASFGSMILADHRGMQSLGETLLVGMAACLVLSVVALPALLQLVQGRGAPDAD
jgi:predicted RND superfamily exporter protein